VRYFSVRRYTWLHTDRTSTAGCRRQFTDEKIHLTPEPQQLTRIRRPAVAVLRSWLRRRSVAGAQNSTSSTRRFSSEKWWAILQRQLA